MTCALRGKVTHTGCSRRRDFNSAERRLRLLCYQLEFVRQSAKLGQGTDVHFPHHITAMDLHGGF
jgi:hypothetical protein